MLKHLKLQHVGPSAKLEVDFSSRLNLITGDNGLGKSFLLDIAWWAMTRRWPGEDNPRLTSGRKALPAETADDKPKLASGRKALVAGTDEPSIGFSFTSKVKTEDYVSVYDRRAEAWTGRPGRPANPGLVFYAMSDGSFAVWDPARNYWRTQNDIDVQERVPAYVFSPTEVWDGLVDSDGKRRCLGLVTDWAGWQKEKSAAFDVLTNVLAALSPSEKERLVPGKLTRIDFDDARDIPTIKMPYGQEVPVLHASAGIRRILSLAYLLVWAWEEHCKAARLLKEEPTRQMVLLIDEVECHLHPQWQRKIIPALLEVAKILVRKESVELQLIAATHSPLVMTSTEPFFDSSLDAWWDLDLERRRVVLTRRPFEKYGDAGGWLTSEAFDLPSGRSIEYENLVKKASALISDPEPLPNTLKDMNEKLVQALSPTDDFLFNWRYVCKSKGWME